MSEGGWRSFIAADGLDDWVVLHGGPTAVYRVASMADGARLAGLIAAVPGVAGSHAALAVNDRAVTVRLTREMWGLEADHIQIARAVSAVASAFGATADRAATQEVQVAISAKPDVIDLPFWRTVLGYVGMADDNGVDPLGHGSTVWMQDLDPAKPLRHAMHIDVSVAREHAQARRDAAVAAGGHVVDDSNAPGTWILSDRAGNKVCIASWPDGAHDPGAGADPAADAAPAAYAQPGSGPA
jgi:4a-hydroxytetrahydrobiopterin dehydratase